MLWQIHSRWQIRVMKAVDVCRKSSEVSTSDDIPTPDDTTGYVHLASLPSHKDQRFWLYPAAYMIYEPSASRIRPENRCALQPCNDSRRLPPVLNKPIELSRP